MKMSSQQAQHTAAGAKKTKANAKTNSKKTDVSAAATVAATNATATSQVDVGGGGGGGAVTVAPAAAAAGKERKLSDKKPLHCSMEQLDMKASKKQATTATTTNAPKRANASRSAAGANWNSALGVATTPEKTKAADVTNMAMSNGTTDETTTANNAPNVENQAAPQSKAARLRQKRKAAQRNKYLAMDCEMVGVGFNGQEDMLARVSIVNKQGEVLLDKFVKPRETVTDYRTSISGIRPRDIEHAEEFSKVQDEVVELLQGKILVGHGIRNDLAVLHIKHPYANIRDTSRYKPLCRLVSNGRTPSLKLLCQAVLGVEIQTGEHNSVEDARAAMNIYNRLASNWEKHIQKHQHHHHHHHGK